MWDEGELEVKYAYKAGIRCTYHGWRADGPALVLRTAVWVLVRVRAVKRGNTALQHPARTPPTCVITCHNLL